MIRHRRPQTGPSVEHSNTDAYTPAEGAELLCRLAEQKALQPYDHIFLKAFLGGVYLSFGGFLYLIVGGGSAGLTASNPGLVRIIEGLVFPVGLVLIVLTGTELFTGNIVTFTVGTLAGRTTLFALFTNLTLSFLGNLAGALFFEGILVYYADATLLADPYKTFVANTAVTKVHVPGWHQIFLRAITCNWLVCLSIQLAALGKDLFSKILIIYIVIACFISEQFEHVVANFFIVQMGMMLGTPISVGYYIWKSVIPVTLGNLVGGALFVGAPIWYLYLAGPAPWHAGGRKLEPGTAEGGPSGPGVAKGPRDEGGAYEMGADHGDGGAYGNGGPDGHGGAYGNGGGWRQSDAGTVDTMDGRAPLTAGHQPGVDSANMTRRVSARHIV